MRRDAVAIVDFSVVPPQQQGMHERLENWGRACYGRAGDTTAPMFRQFVPAQHWAQTYGSSTAVPTDQQDARRIGVGVYHLPEPHRLSLQWYYVQRSPIIAARRALSCTTEALARYVLDGRTMLINRGV